MAASLLQLLILLITFSFTSLAAPLLNTRDDVLLLPSKDPFYQAGVDLSSCKLGDIIKKRQVPVPASIELLAPGKTKAAWQILYRSQDDYGQPLAVVTTIFVPNFGDPNKFLTSAVAYDSSNVDCSPSYSVRNVTGSPPEVIIMATALNLGWYVQTPDYESYKAAFTNGIISGQTLLDSLRAAKKSGSFTGLSSDPKIGLNGGSGGALACEWAVELQPSYAKDIKIAGATLGALTPNIANVMLAVNKGPDTGLIPSAITGLAAASAEVTKYLKDNLVPSTAADFWSATTRCLQQNSDHYKDKDMFAYFKNPGFLKDKLVNDLVERVGIMGRHGTPTGPVYIYKGVKDVLSPVEDTDALYDKFCADKAPSVTYIRNDLTDHAGEAVLGLPGAIAWLTDRFNGVAAKPGCTKYNTEKPLVTADDVKQLGDNAATIVAAMQAELAAPLKGVTSLLGALSGKRMV